MNLIRDLQVYLYFIVISLFLVKTPEKCRSVCAMLPTNTFPFFFITFFHFFFFDNNFWISSEIISVCFSVFNNFPFVVKFLSLRRNCRPFRSKVQNIWIFVMFMPSLCKKSFFHLEIYSLSLHWYIKHYIFIKL